MRYRRTFDDLKACWVHPQNYSRKPRRGGKGKEGMLRKRKVRQRERTKVTREGR